MYSDLGAAPESTPLDLGFDPGDMGFVANPYPAYECLRDQGPIVYDEATDHWLVTRFDDVRSLLRDRRFGRTYLHLTTHEDMGHEPPPVSRDAFWHLSTTASSTWSRPTTPCAPARVEGVHAAHGRVDARAGAAPHRRTHRRLARRR